MHKPASVREEEAQQKPGQRHQAPFFRMAALALLDSIAIHEEIENSSAVKKGSAKNKKERLVILVDNTLNDSFEALVWSRSDRNLDAEPATNSDHPLPAEKEKSLVKKPAEDIQQELGISSLLGLGSFLRKAAVLDSIGKHEAEEKPGIVESSGKKKKKKGRPSTLVDKRMDTSEEALVWTRCNRTLATDAFIQVDSFGSGPPMVAKKEEVPAKNTEIAASKATNDTADEQEITPDTSKPPVSEDIKAAEKEAVFESSSDDSDNGTALFPAEGGKLKIDCNAETVLDHESKPKKKARSRKKKSRKRTKSPLGDGAGLVAKSLFFPEGMY